MRQVALASATRKTDLSHILDDIVAQERVKAGIAEGARDVAYATGDHSVTFAEFELVTVVEVDNDFLCIERRCNDALAAKNMGRSESIVEHLKSHGSF